MTRARRGKATALAMIVAAVGLAAGPAWSETASDRAACTPSVLTLCPHEALTLNRHAAMQCLLAKLSRATPQCQAVVHERLASDTARPTRTAARAPR